MALRRGHRAFCAAALIIIAATWLAVAGRAAAADKVCCQLMWYNQAQFAGFYMAQDKGIYAKYGLDVELRGGGPGISPLREMLDGRCTFAVAWLSEAITMSSRGAELVNLAQLLRRSATVLVGLRKNGVGTLKDLQFRRVAMWGGLISLPAKAMLRAADVSVDVVPESSTMMQLISGAVGAAAAMRYNELHVLYQMGVDFEEMVIFDMADQGLNIPEDGIYARRQTWRENPDLCRRFVAATLEGWRLAVAKPEEAMACVMKRVDKDHAATNRSHQKWMLDTMGKLIMPQGDETMGRLSREDFEQADRILVQQGFIDKPVPWAGFAADAWKVGQ